MSGETSSPPALTGSAAFAWGCALEGALLIVAIGLAALVDLPLLANLRWDGTGALLGVAASVPLLAVFRWLMRSSWRAVSGITRFLEEVVRPIIAGWTVWQMAVISAMAGVSEEVLFRGVLQGGLSAYWGTGPALVMASLLFGLAHCVNTAYVVIVTMIGACLGGIWLWSGNLLVPIVAHAGYDFMALVYLARNSGWDRRRR